MPRKLRFSDRVGVTQPPTILQLDTMSEPLRNSLWNVLLETVFETNNPSQRSHAVSAAQMIWGYFLHRTLDTLPTGAGACVSVIKQEFFDEHSEWWKVYNLLEFLAVDYLSRTSQVTLFHFQRLANDAFEEHLAGYRLIEGSIIPISSEAEVSAIEEAISLAQENELLGAAKHLHTAIGHLAKKPEPDFRNSVKESISAVESVAKQLTGQKAGGLKAALMKLKSENVYLHPAFEEGVLRLYGYTSDADGIRHALLEEPKVGFDEAKFMLVTCSAFVNFLIAKASSCGLFRTSDS